MLRKLIQSGQVAPPTCLVLLVHSHPAAPSGDGMLEALPVIEGFGLVRLPKQLHGIFFSQDGELLPLSAPRNSLVKARSLLILNEVTFRVFLQ